MIKKCELAANETENVRKEVASSHKVRAQEDLIRDLKRTIDNQKAHYDFLYNSKDMVVKHVEELNHRLEKEKKKQTDLIEQLEDSERNIDALKSKLEKSHDTNQKMLIQIKHLRDQIDSIKISSKLISDENEKLKLTLGTNYYDLTPRPNWGGMKNSFNFDLVDSS